MTEFKIKGLYIAVFIKDSKNNLSGAIIIREFGITLPGDTIEGESLKEDLDCKNVARIEVDGANVGKRSIKKMKFKTDKEAKEFINNLLAVSSDHDHGIAKLTIELR